MSNIPKTILNTDQLDALKELNESPSDDIISELIDIFIEHSPTTISLLKEAKSNSDFENIKKLAHKLKGSCANLGAEILRFYCQELEDNAEKMSDKELSDHVESLDVAYDQAVGALKKDWYRA